MVVADNTSVPHDLAMLLKVTLDPRWSTASRPTLALPTEGVFQAT